MNAYLLVKWLHVAGAAILFGTGIGIAFHLRVAVRGGNVVAIAAAARATVLADFVFTLPAIVLQPLTGIALASTMGYPLASAWIVASFALYLVAGACWIPVVFIQLRLRALAEKAASDGAPLVPARLARLHRGRRDLLAHDRAAGVISRG